MDVGERGKIRVSLGLPLVLVKKKGKGGERVAFS